MKIYSQAPGLAGLSHNATGRHSSITGSTIDGKMSEESLSDSDVVKKHFDLEKEKQKFCHGSHL